MGCASSTPAAPPAASTANNKPSTYTNNANPAATAQPYVAKPVPTTNTNTMNNTSSTNNAPVANASSIGAIPTIATPVGQKFRFENGRLVMNTLDVSTNSYVAPAPTTTPAPANAPPPMLAVVCSPVELAEATQLCEQNGKTLLVSSPTQQAVEGFYNPDFVQRYMAPPEVSGEALLEGLTAQFSRFEIPIGMLHDLLKLSQYRLNFIIDDSGSMQLDTDSIKGRAQPLLLNRFKATGQDLQKPMSRWEEVEDRLHTMIDILAYLPVQVMMISFLNRPQRLLVDRTNKTPEDYAREAHVQVDHAFKTQPQGGTPTLKKLSEVFATSYVPTHHYFFTDGEPSDGTPAEVCRLLVSRRDPKNNPVTFISCTNDDAATGWMKSIDEKGPFIAEVDDFNDERAEVVKNQGPIYPYTRGFWLISLMLGSISSEIDGLDEPRPISKNTFERVILGRSLTDEEYTAYWESNTWKNQFRGSFLRFLREEHSSSIILGLRSPAATPM